MEIRCYHIPDQCLFCKRKPTYLLLMERVITFRRHGMASFVCEHHRKKVSSESVIIKELEKK